MNKRKTQGFLASVVMLLAVGGVAYAQTPGSGKSLQPIVTGQTGHIFQTNIVLLGLQKLGYQIKQPLEADYPAMFLSIAQGQADYTVNFWLPLHQSFYEKAGGDAVLAKVGPIIAGARQGYFIDRKTADKYNIKTVDQLRSPEIAKLFDSDRDGKADLTGCDPGWGCEREIEHQLDAFKLRPTVTHRQGSYFALIADTITRYQAGESIFYYTWSPLWVGSVLEAGKDVVPLNVPFSASTDGSDTALPDGTNPGFKVNDIYVLASKKFLNENPPARRLLELIKIPLEDVNAMTLRQYKGEKTPQDIMAQAQAWVAKHQAEFDGWVREAAAVK